MNCVSASWPCTAFTRNWSLMCILLKSPVRSWTVTSVTRPTSLSGVSVGVSPSSCLLNISGASRLYHTFAFHLSLILRAAARDFFSAMQAARRGGRYLRVREGGVAGGRSADPTGETIRPASASHVRGGPSSQATNRVLVRPDLRARALDRCPCADRPARLDRCRLVARPRGLRLRVHRADRGLGPVHGQHHLPDDLDARGLAPQHPDVVPGRDRTVPLQSSLRFTECSTGRPSARESRVRCVCGRLVSPDGSPGEFRAPRGEEPFDPAGFRHREELPPVPEPSPSCRGSLSHLPPAEPRIGADARLVHPARHPRSLAVANGRAGEAACEDPGRRPWPCGERALKRRRNQAEGTSCTMKIRSPEGPAVYTTRYAARKFDKIADEMTTFGAGCSCAPTVVHRSRTSAY